MVRVLKVVSGVCWTLSVATRGATLTNALTAEHQQQHGMRRWRPSTGRNPRLCSLAAPHVLEGWVSTLPLLMLSSYLTQTGIPDSDWNPQNDLHVRNLSSRGSIQLMVCGGPHHVWCWHLVQCYDHQRPAAGQL
jgi:hypothetical protein